MVESTPLLRERTGNRTEGSNPSRSAVCSHLGARWPSTELESNQSLRIWPTGFVCEPVQANICGSVDLTVENGSTSGQTAFTLNGDGNEDRNSPEACGDDAICKSNGISPKAVASRIFGTNAEGTSRFQGSEPRINSRPDLAKSERAAIVADGTLPKLNYLSSIDARGTEHNVRFRGNRVEKQQRSSGWTPIITPEGKVGLAEASPLEYLRRLDLQNELFGDDIKIIGLTPGNRFAITQPTLKGGEPTEIEIRDVLEGAGWRRIPIGLQDLPPELMGSAWWHREEQVMLLDARKPNLKKTDFGAVLPIDLILADLTPEMRDLLEAS